MEPNIPQQIKAGGTLRKRARVPEDVELLLGFVMASRDIYLLGGSQNSSRIDRMTERKRHRGPLPLPGSSIYVQ